MEIKQKKTLLEASLAGRESSRSRNFPNRRQGARRREIIIGTLWLRRRAITLFHTKQRDPREGGGKQRIMRLKRAGRGGSRHRISLNNSFASEAKRSTYWKYIISLELFTALSRLQNFLPVSSCALRKARRRREKLEAHNELLSRFWSDCLGRHFPGGFNLGWKT